VTKALATEAYWSSGMTKAKCSISKVEQDNFILRIDPIIFSCEEKKNIGMKMQMKFTISMHIQILNSVCSHYKQISKFVLRI
jgi:hypothetical protein